MNMFLKRAVALFSMLMLMSHVNAEANETTDSKTKGGSGVVAKVGSAVDRGAKATASGIERGVKAAGRGLDKGATATANAANNVSRKIESKTGSSSSNGK